MFSLPTNLITKAFGLERNDMPTRTGALLAEQHDTSH